MAKIPEGLSMKLLPLLLASCLYGKDCISKPCSAAFNFAYDLVGTPDSRLGTWGLAGAQTSQVKFKAPIGYRVRVLRVYGDLTWWPRGTPEEDGSDKVIGKAAGVLLGLSNTAPDGSELVEGGGASDNCFLYIQDASKGEAKRTPFDYDTRVGGLLEEDNTMNVKFAVWLNTLDRCVHAEPSITVVFVWEKKPSVSGVSSEATPLPKMGTIYFDTSVNHCMGYSTDEMKWMQVANLLCGRP